MSITSILILRLGLGLALLVMPGGAVWPDAALAQSPGMSEKEAFEAAKSLGTVEAWDAFLSNYPNGFHADLARAYVKKLTEQTPSASPSPTAPSIAASDDFPVAAGSWGGVLRDGPGKHYRQIGSLKEGEPVTLMGRADVSEDGFPWFKLVTQSGLTGYQWGGILCSTGAERPDLFKTCPAASSSQSGTKKQEPRCKNNGEWDGLRCRPAGFFDKPKKKRCPAGQYLNQNGVCQPNQTGG